MDPRTVHLPSSRLSKATMDDLRREHFKYGTESIEWKSTTHSVHFTDTPVAGERRKAAMGASGGRAAPWCRQRLLALTMRCRGLKELVDAGA